jgi:ribosomal protein S18 acetylase RimI-like enzyme
VSAQFRLATDADLPAVVRLLADDRLGATRERVEDPLPDCYRSAFAAMRTRPGDELIVATIGNEVVGCLQLLILPGLSRQGTFRGQIEAVRIASAHRNAGLGEALIRHAIERARAAGCTIIQLTSDASRVDARRFYERLGFQATHVGMKLQLPPE